MYRLHIYTCICVYYVVLVILLAFKNIYFKLGTISDSVLKRLKVFYELPMKC